VSRLLVGLITMVLGLRPIFRPGSIFIPAIVCGRRVPNHRQPALDQVFDVPKVSPLGRVAKRNRLPAGAGPRRPPDTMDVTFRFVGKLEVYDVGDTIDIDATRGNIGRHQDPRVAVAKLFESPLAGALGFVAVDCLNGDATFAELVGDPVGAMLGAGEHDHPRQRRITHDIGEQGRLSGGGDVIEALFDALDRGCLGCHLDADRID